MLKVILNRLKPQIKEKITEEQAGFRAEGRNTNQILKFRNLSENDFQHQQNLNNVFIDFKNAFDRVWHVALWDSMQKYNISTHLVRTFSSCTTRLQV